MPISAGQPENHSRGWKQFYGQSKPKPTNSLPYLLHLLNLLNLAHQLSQNETKALISAQNDVYTELMSGEHYVCVRESDGLVLSTPSRIQTSLKTTKMGDIY